MKGKFQESSPEAIRKYYSAKLISMSLCLLSRMPTS